MREAFLDPQSLETVTASLAHDGHPVKEQFPFHPLPDALAGPVIGIDGGSAIVLETGFSTIGAWRAGWAGLALERRSEVPQVGPLHLAVVSDDAPPGHDLARLEEWLGEDFLAAFHGAWAGATPQGRLGLLREAEERALTARLLQGNEGTLVLADGAMETGPLGPSVLHRLGRLAREQGAWLAGLSKTTAISFRGRPLVPLLRQAAPDAPWWTPVDESITGQEGSHIVSPAGAQAFRLDLVNGPIEPMLARLRTTTNDLAVPGYPYPLYRVHCDVAMGPDEVSRCRILLEEALAARGLSLPASFHETLDVMR